ncbi:hypothetical protein O181_081962 [Austropuccinia psidii MF-1]|uniref:Uncharacterized protein n=1 Tax=Austropuccinia psidii MF-1 TaxID=1389203 RepID=A0A9Q3IIS8_9BASI|nr:hypothetical protein [Austropuccinia psidii MF-1]
MSHTLTYHRIQSFQLHHHHIERGIGPYKHDYAPAPVHAHANAPPHAHTNATAVLCSGLYQCHPQNDNPAEAESFHGGPGEVKHPLYIKTG